jgi:tyrosyl-tRNA synthetase
MPTVTIKSEILDVNILDLLTSVGLVSSKSEGRRLMEQNGISINQEKETDVNRIITKKDFQKGFLIVQKGKKVFLKIELEA